MWSLTITSPKSEPLQIKLVPGKMMIGRLKTCDIVIDDPIASRRHADIYYDPLPELVTIKDLNSINGTYVNRRQITDFVRLQDGDQVRIGQTVMHLARLPDKPGENTNVSGTQMFSRDLVLEALDEHPIVLNEIVEKLNTVVSMDAALHQLIDLVKRAMGADLCEIIPAADFPNINNAVPDGLIARSIRNSSVETTPKEICLPVLVNGAMLAVIHLQRSRPDSHPFDKRDVQLAVAISHQTGLTFQRIQLINAVRIEEQRAHNLRRFISPVESQELLEDYLQTGIQPALTEKKVTVMSVEITDPGMTHGSDDPAGFSSFLKPFFHFSTEAIHRRGGLVRYLGDGVLGIFLEVPDAPSAEARAVDAAQEIIYFIKNDAPFKVDQVGVVGVAICSGTAMAGYVGGGNRLEFNVLGSLVRNTIEMQGHAFPNRILVDAATAAVMRGKMAEYEAGTLELQGSKEPVVIYEVALRVTSPLVQTDKEKETLSNAFRSVAEKFRKAKKETTNTPE